MYEAYFNFRLKPFDLVPNPVFIFHSRSHKKALTFLDYGIRERAGFMLLTGDVGSGKTTLVRDLLDKHYERVVLAKVFNTKVDSVQLLAMINDEFGLPVAGKDKITLIRDLNIFLIDQFAKGNQPILIIDEAQNLGAELLEEIRMLSNLETADNKLLQIILVGQPELRTILASPALLQLRQRISINCHLKPIDRFETELYILHRLTIAGNPQAVSFAPEAFDIIYAASRGIPRLINIICDFALLAAFAEEVREIDAESLQEIVADLDFEHHFWADHDDILTGTHLGELLVTGRESGRRAEVVELLANISQRLELLEGSSLQLNGTALRDLLKDFNNRLSSLQGVLKAHVDESETMINDLSCQLETVRKMVGQQGGQSRPGLLTTSARKAGK